MTNQISNFFLKINFRKEYNFFLSFAFYFSQINFEIEINKINFTFLYLSIILRNFIRQELILTNHDAKHALTFTLGILDKLNARVPSPSVPHDSFLPLKGPSNENFTKSYLPLLLSL